MRAEPDFSAEAVLRLRANFDDGMLAAYLDAKPERDAKHPIVTLKAR